MRLVLALASVVAFSGCACKPLLEVREVADAPQGASMSDWTEFDASTWPEVDALIRATGPGDHGHVAWSDEQTRRLWFHFGLDPDGTQNEVYVRHGDLLYRIRALLC